MKTPGKVKAWFFRSCLFIIKTCHTDSHFYRNKVEEVNEGEEEENFEFQLMSDVDSNSEKVKG